VACTLGLQARILCAAFYIVSKTPVYPAGALALNTGVFVSVEQPISAIFSVILECVVALSGGGLASSIELTTICDWTGDVLDEAHVLRAVLVLSTTCLCSISVVLAFWADVFAAVLFHRLRIGNIAKKYRFSTTYIWLFPSSAELVALAVPVVAALLHALSTMSTVALLGRYIADRATSSGMFEIVSDLLAILHCLTELHG